MLDPTARYPPASPAQRWGGFVAVCRTRVILRGRTEMRVRVRKRWRLFRFDLDFCLFIATTYTLDCNGVGYRFWTITGTTPDCAGRDLVGPSSERHEDSVLAHAHQRAKISRKMVRAARATRWVNAARVRTWTESNASAACIAAGLSTAVDADERH